jgi:hypothetical protein
MAFGSGMGSPEELAIKLKELAGQMRPQQADPVGIGMNVGGPPGRSMPGMATPGLGPYSSQGIGTDKAALQQTGGDPYMKPPVVSMGSPAPGVGAPQPTSPGAVDRDGLTQKDRDDLDGNNGNNAKFRAQQKFGSMVR